VAHEYLISGSFSIIRYWAFLSLIGQVPVIIAMDSLKSQLDKSQLGNVFFWVMFCIVGQPLAVIFYSYYALTASSDS
jgi:diacylglycerol O-acyltransferase-1